MKLVVGDYLEVAGGFDGVCLVDSSLQRLTEAYPSVVNTVQHYFSKYGKRVFNCGCDGGNIPRIIFFPLDDANMAKISCGQITSVIDKLELNSILIPKPWNYKDIRGILESELDDRFILISDDANDIPIITQASIEQPKVEENIVMPQKKVLECSSAGDKRFSAMYAVVEYMGVEDTIEHHYQGSKRFLVNEVFVPSDSPKGKKVDACEVFGVLYEPGALTSFYNWLWVKYFDTNPDLLAYAGTFDDFTDKFRGKSINCQADIINDIVTNGIDKVKVIVSSFSDLENNWIANLDPNELPFGIEEETPTNPSEQFSFDVEDTIEYKPVTVCVTGHRPDKLWGYNNSANYSQLQNKIYQCVEYFYSAYNVTRFISGGAQGADQLFFGVVDYFRKKVPSVENIVYIPFIGQETTWRLNNSMFSEEDYKIMLENATSTVVCDESFKTTRVMSQSERNIYRGKVVNALTNRNTCMVRDTNFVIGIYNGDINLVLNDTPSNGGTLDCLRKAYREGKGIVVINPNTLETSRINM